MSALDRAGLLHNMSTRPSTPVTWRLRPLGDSVAWFEVGALPRVRLDDPALAPGLETSWAGYALRGAVDLFPWSATLLREDHGYREALRSVDRSLVLNVLGRARSQLLLATTPLALEPGLLDQRLATDDERIVRLVRASRHEREVAP